MIINVLDYLEGSEKRFPDKIAFFDEENNITYSRLLIESRSIASAILENIPESSGKPIVVFVDRNIECLTSFMGIAYSGNFYVPIDMQMPRLRIELILDTLKPVAILAKRSDMNFAVEVSSGLRILNFEESVGFPIDEEKLMKVRRINIDTDPLYTTFTSGSTGIPKGVITNHKSVIDLTEQLVDTFGFNSDTIFGNQNPFYFDASIKDIYCTLKCGASMHIIPRKCFVFPAQLIGFLNTKKINSILWSAAAIAHVANTNAFEKEKPLYLKKIMFSGEVMHNRILNYWRRALPEADFVNLYGPTEITSVCTFFFVDRPFDNDEVLPIGVPFRNSGIMILNENDKLVEGEEIGEICVRGSCLALGYYNDKLKTTEAFCQNPLNESYPEIIYRTGDLARYNQKGQIIFLSRKDNQVKHMGHRVELGEIEIIINSLELIEGSICFYDHEKQKIVLIYMGSEADKKYILDSIKEKLPKYMFPNIIITQEKLPYNVNGKIDRSLLKEKYNRGEIR
jgi:amino acid adenylation domain-containing protein